MMASRKVNLAPMVTHTFPLEEIVVAFETAYDKSQGTIKVQIGVCFSGGLVTACSCR